jgi:hypothetical protein
MIGRLDNISSTSSSFYSVNVNRYSRLKSVFHSYGEVYGLFEIPDTTEPIDKMFHFHITMSIGEIYVPDGYSYIDVVHRIDVPKPTISTASMGSGYAGATLNLNIDQGMMINTAYLVFGMETPSLAEKREATIDTLLEKEEPA